MGLRDRVAIIRAMLHTISSPQPYAGYGDLSGVGRRWNLSEAACYDVPYLAPQKVAKGRIDREPGGEKMEK